MTPKNIKLRVEFNEHQHSVFRNALFACQMFRNHSLTYLKQRYFDKRQWTKHNEHTHEYQTYLTENTIYLEQLKEFKKTYTTKAERVAHKKDQPSKPQRIHPLLESNSIALNRELTSQLDKAKEWLMKNLPAFEPHLKAHGLSLPKKNPQNMCVYFSSLPLSVRKSLGKSAKNENVLLYLLGSPRSCLVQVLQDLDKTFSRAFDDREKFKENNSGNNQSKSGHTNTIKNTFSKGQTKEKGQRNHSNTGKVSGFPKMKRLRRDGGIRFQLDVRLESYTNSWANQHIVTSEFGELNWYDSGYILPKNPAQVLTIKKEKNGQMFLVFSGTPEYNDKRLEQKERAQLRKKAITPAKTAEEFLDKYTVGVDLNRKSGQIQIVTDIEQPVVQDKVKQLNNNSNSNSTNADADADADISSKITHIVSVLSSRKEKKRLTKIKKRDAYIKRQQQHMARQDQARKKGRGKPKNPNGLHLKSKHSNRRMKTQSKIAVACAKDKAEAQSYTRDLVKQLIDGMRVVCTEKLSVFNMLQEDNKNKTDKNDKDLSQDKNKKDDQSFRNKKRNNNRSQCRARFSMCMKMIEEECKNNGITLLKCDRYDPTSQYCSELGCGFHWGHKDTTIRTITCPGCGVVHDRDVNAAKNVKFLALYRYAVTVKNKPVAESVTGGKTGVTSLAQISYEVLMTYIKGRYPIKTVIETIERNSAKHQKSEQKDAVKQTASSIHAENV